MKLRDEEIRRISMFIIDRLEKKEMVTLKAPREEITARIEEVIGADMAREAELDREVEKLIDQHISAAGGDVNRRKLFLMIKKKMAAERGIIL